MVWTLNERIIDLKPAPQCKPRTDTLPSLCLECRPQYGLRLLQSSHHGSCITVASSLPQLPLTPRRGLEAVRMLSVRGWRRGSRGLRPRKRPPPWQEVETQPSVAYQYSQRLVGGVPVAEEAAVPHGDDSAAAAADGASGEWSGSATARRASQPASPSSHIGYHIWSGATASLPYHNVSEVVPGRCCHCFSGLVLRARHHSPCGAPSPTMWRVIGNVVAGVAS